MMHFNLTEAILNYCFLYFVYRILYVYRIKILLLQCPIIKYLKYIYISTAIFKNDLLNNSLGSLLKHEVTNIRE